MNSVSLLVSCWHTSSTTLSSLFLVDGWSLLTLTLFITPRLRGLLDLNYVQMLVRQSTCEPSCIKIIEECCNAVQFSGAGFAILLPVFYTDLLFVRRYMFGLSIVLAIFQGIGMLFLPKSPRYLMLKGDRQQVRRITTDYNIKSYNIVSLCVILW